ncbi:MAG: hypothetical protein HC859_09335 [Bacteroidia bacterium]|nr:hypothetical protein [Bacteroidia bacterium]
MSFKPDDADLMAYLYDELTGVEKENVERFLLENEEARLKLEQLRGLRAMMRTVDDKEVIAPPIFLDEHKAIRLWHSPYFRTIVTLAASVLLIMVVGWIIDLRVEMHDNAMTIGFGPRVETPAVVDQPEPAGMLTKNEVQEMISSSLANNNASMQTQWDENQRKLNASIKNNLADNSGKIDQLVRQASLASQQQIQQYVASLQTEHMTVVRDYFQLTSAQQKEYIENLLVDFAKYLQQQRNDDLVLMQTRLMNLEQNTNIFKQETEQILTSIISSNPRLDNSTKNY